ADDSHVVDVLKPAISVDKSVDQAAIIAGQSVTYTFVVTNSGEETLTAVVLDDELLAYTEDVGTLIPGQVATFTAGPYTPEESVTNTATVEGYDVLDTRAEDTDTADVVVYDPAIAIDTTVDFDGDGIYSDHETYYAGEDATWRYVVTNTGDSDLSDVTVTDPFGNTFDAGVLSPGASATFTHTAPVLTGTTVEASAVATDVLGNAVGPVADDASVSTIDPALTVTKTGPDFAYVGEEITYTITVTNTGDHALTNVRITDAMLGVDITVPTLAPNVPYVITETYTVTDTDTDPLPNTAAAIGYDALGGPVAADDSHVVDVLKPAISVDKSVDQAAIIAGQSVTYTFVVTNSGEETLTA
ncbi:MAG: hypothetical protein Q8K89_14205, partial [Actinomycetota bacterium]|nr:hypothetical protein [Actinomycetota bacterium]